MLHIFEPADVFKVLYRDVFLQVSEARVIAFKESEDVILRSGFINMVEEHLAGLFEQSVRDPMTPSARIHMGNLRRFKGRLQEIQSTSTCLSCLLSRPQYGLPCGHCVCENCVLVFGECYVDDPWIFKIHACFLCWAKIPEEVIVRVHPPTARVGVLCIDGGGVRGTVPLQLMKQIQERMQMCINLPIPLQNSSRSLLGLAQVSY